MPSMTLGELVELYLVRRHGAAAERRRAGHHARLWPVVELVGPGRPVELVRLVDFERAQIELKCRRQKNGKLYSPFTVHSYFRAVRAMLNWAVGLELIERSPLVGFRFDGLPQPNPKAVTQSTFEALVSAAGDERHQLYYWMTVRDAAIVAVLRECQCTPAAIAGALVGDVDLRRRRFQIGELRTTRYGQAGRRWVQLGQGAMDRLRAWGGLRSSVALPSAGQALWLRQERDKGMGWSAMYYLLDRLAERAGLVGAPDVGATRPAVYRALLKAAADGGRYNHQWQAARDVALLYMLRDTGARVGGLVGASVESLDLERGRLMVREKGGKFRNVYLTPATVERVEAWLGVRAGVVQPSAGGALFIRSDGRAGLNAGGVATLLRTLARRAGVASARCNPHSFRHAFARDLLSAGVDLSRVSRMMGHSGIEVTADYYARWADDELRQAHSQASPLRRGRGGK